MSTGLSTQRLSDFPAASWRRPIEGFFFKTPTSNRKEISHGIDNSSADVQNVYLLYSLSLACSPFEWRSMVQQGVNLPLRHLSSLQTIQEGCQVVE